MITVVNAPQIAVRPHCNAVRIVEYAVPPCALYIALGVKHDHRVRAAIEHVHVVIFVHIHGGRFFVCRALRKIAPILARHLIDPVSRTKQYHIRFLR